MSGGFKMRRFLSACFCIFLILSCDQVRFIPIQDENKKIIQMDCGRHLELTLMTSLRSWGLHYKIKIVDAVNGIVMPHNVIISCNGKSIHYRVYNGRSKVINDSLDLKSVSDLDLDYFFELPSDSASTVTISGNKFLVTGVDTCSFGSVSTSIRKK
jgi:hypothetical protein